MKASMASQNIVLYNINFYELIAILRRQHHKILTASLEKIYSILGGVAQRQYHKISTSQNMYEKTNKQAFSRNRNTTLYWLFFFINFMIKLKFSQIGRAHV